MMTMTPMPLFGTEPADPSVAPPAPAAPTCSLETWETTAKKLEERTAAAPDNAAVSDPELGSCWYWLGAISASGHGRLALGHRSRLVGPHVVAWVAANGRAPAADEVVRHRCDEPVCVRPSHLEIGSQLDNINDRELRGRGFANSVDTRGPAGRSKAIRDHLLAHPDGWDGLRDVLEAGDPHRHQTRLPLVGV